MARKSTNKHGAEELPRPEKRFVGNCPPLPRPVDDIAEDDKEPASVLAPSNNGRVQPVNPPAKQAGTSHSRNITNMDLDDITNGSDDEKSEHLALSNFRTPKPTKISKSARDLIDFWTGVPRRSSHLLFPPNPQPRRPSSLQGASNK